MGILCYPQVAYHRAASDFQFSLVNLTVLAGFELGKDLILCALEICKLHTGIDMKHAFILDSTRIKILYLLFESEMCVCDIAQMLRMTQSAISHQLRVLKQMDLVKSRREGKTIFYSLADGHITTILSQGLDHIQEDEVR